MAQDAKIALEGLKSKITILMSMFSIVKSQNEELHKTNENLKEIINKQQNSIIELEQKVNTLQLAKAVSDSSGDTDQKSARKYIEGLIREIDSCIALLNK
jgi:predicted RNase H-like nuclease (RuvC/YqgF family)